MIIVGNIYYSHYWQIHGLPLGHIAVPLVLEI